MTLKCIQTFSGTEVLGKGLKRWWPVWDNLFARSCVSRSVYTERDDQSEASICVT